MMKRFVMPKEPSGWAWLIIAVLLAFGLFGFEYALYAAVAFSTLQSGWFLWKYADFKPYSVQVRLAYTVYLFVALLPGLHWMVWLPTVATFVRVLSGYCLMARMLSLMPWNRSAQLTPELVWDTFFTPPTVGRPDYGLPASDCVGGVCEIEAQIGQHRRTA